MVGVLGSLQPSFSSEYDMLSHATVQATVRPLGVKAQHQFSFSDTGRPGLPWHSADQLCLVSLSIRSLRRREWKGWEGLSSSKNPPRLLVLIIELGDCWEEEKVLLFFLNLLNPVSSFLELRYCYLFYKTERMPPILRVKWGVWGKNEMYKRGQKAQTPNYKISVMGCNVQKSDYC